MIDWSQITGFKWDEGNSRKNAEKHSVGQSEAEQVFFNQPLLVLADEKHSLQEPRYHVLGIIDSLSRRPENQPKFSTCVTFHEKETANKNEKTSAIAGMSG